MRRHRRFRSRIWQVDAGWSHHGFPFARSIVVRRTRRRKLDNDYRVDAIEENRIVLTYLPLGTQRVLSFSATSTERSL